MAKDTQIKVRITQEEKEKILAHCEDHNIKNISEFLRLAIIKQLKEKE